ncbi:ubinuclein-2-like isoform X2 [Planococcus citri]|uniref:ubinuclein-2-like isoform X2 n=1 Tax=Planococcus citri TaxID=170843 RepID=UPI0031F83624
MSVENKSDTKSNKDEKCVLNKKLYSATIRLTVSLREPDEESCSVFNYISLVAEEKRNRRHAKEKLALNGNLDENEEVDDEVKKLAQHFEEKYGGGTAAKKKKKKKAPTFYNYTELAAGYDESDSFIDNSEAFDEALPDEMKTFHGGYYVNVGQLKFKKVELGDDNSEFEEIRVGKKKSCVIKSDDSDSEDDSSKSDIEKSESVDDEVESPHKKLPEETNHKGAENTKNVNEVVKTNGSEKLKPEKSKENVPSNGPISVNGEILVKKRKKYKKRRLEEDDGPVDGLSKPKKKAITVKTLLEEKRVVVENGDTSVPVPAPASVPAPVPSPAPVLKLGVDNGRNSINDVIESVVRNSTKVHSEDSRDSTCSSSDAKSIDSRTSYDTEKDSHHDEMEVTEASSAACGFPNIPKEQIKLPDNLPSDVLELISQIKNAAQNSDLGVRTFFNPYINSKLLSLEIKVRPLMSSARHALYGHLSSFLPCSKDTLMKRAKKLLIEEEEKHMAEPFKKLKVNIDKVMPALLNNYDIALQKALEEKVSDSTKNGEADEKKISPKLPPRKFIWTEETRSCLRDLVACRQKCFCMLKPRKETSDEYVRKFLETRVKSLWPAGWMDTPTLLKESHSTNNTTAKAKKTSLTPQNTPPSTASSSTSTTTATSAAPAVTVTPTTTAKKSAHSSVPSISNNSNAAATSISAANFSNLLSLQSLAMQYSQSDLGYPITTSSSIPYGHDLNLLTAAAAAGSNLPFSMDLLSRIAFASAATSSGHQAYTKGKSPPKKQSPSPGYSSSTQRSTTPHSNSASSTNSFADAKKKEKMSNEALMSQYADMIKMDPALNAAAAAAASKNKKEHHMLNHISQYNKHYSHKTEKRKNAGHERKESFSNVKTSTVSTHNNSPATNAKPASCEVLDLSPNKTTKSDAKSETPVHPKTEHHHHHHHHKTESKTNTTVSSSPSTAKDHNYWSSSAKKDDVPEVKEIKQEKPIVVPSIQRSLSTPADTSPPQSLTPKPTTHISRKQRILQESAKSAAQEIFKTSESSKSHSHESAKLTAQSSVSSKESTYVNESRDRSNHNSSKEDGLPSIKNEKKSFNLLEDKQLIEETANATDILSKIINDTLQNDTPLQPQFTNPLFDNTKIKKEIKLEDAEIHINDFIKEKPSQTSTPIREPRPSVEKSSSSTTTAGRKTPSNDRAEIEAADVINDLLALNQIGGRSSMKRLDYQDSRYMDNRHLPAEINFTNGSLMSQSSPHNANNSKTSSIPRMNLTGFQDEFLQHIFKMDRDGSPYNSNSVPQDNCFTPDFPTLENKKSSFNHVSKSSVKPESKS